MHTQFQSQRFSVNCASTSSTSTHTINLLLLGKSGVGKSMFINAFGNYKMYKNMNDIKSLRDIEISVPMAFEMSDYAFNIKQFVVGENKNMDKNENLNFNAASGTQGCKSYKYQFQDTTVNLIDTPGLVDTDGVDKDKENMDAILSFIGQYKYINGICFVFQPDEERLNDVFKYCINELLCQLDHTAASNIIWLFTKAAATLYRVGSTSRAIKLMIDEIHKSKPELNIPFDQKNSFLFDNVSFKYLVARDEIKFSENDIQTFNDSWNRSLEESLRMIRHVVDLRPYDVQASLLINRARELINVLLPHTKEITRNIIENEEILRQKTNEVANFDGSVDDLKKILFIKAIKVKTVIKSHRNRPRIVCQSPLCRKKSFVDDVRDLISNTGVSTSTLGSSLGVAGAAAAVTGIALAGALGYNGHWIFKNKCSMSCCANIEHNINYYAINEIKEEIEDPTITNDINIKSNFIKACEARIGTLQKEKKVIDEANGTFAVFLKQRAIVLYSDAYPAYLKLLIKDAESLKSGTIKAQRLKETLQKYKELQDAIENSSLDDSEQENKMVSVRQINELVQKLIKLPIYGPEIKETLKRMEIIHTNYKSTRGNRDTDAMRRFTALF